MIRTNEIVITDTSLYSAFTRLYAIFIATGIVAVVGLPPSLVTIGGHTLTVFWIIAMGVISGFSFVFSMKERWGRREMISSSLLLGVLGTYSAAIIINTLVHWDLDKAVSAVFSLSYLVFPLWRVRSLYKRYRKPRG